MNSAISITLDDASGVTGLTIYRKGMTFPIADTTAYAGRAIVTSASDTYVKNCDIYGFDWAYVADGSSVSGLWRPNAYQLNIDCNNGVWFNDVSDIGRMENLHAWPFAGVGGSASAQRSGTAYYMSNVGDWNKIVNCFAHGYFTGIKVDSCNNVTILDSGAEYAGTGSGGQTAITVSGTSDGTQIVGSQAVGSQIGIYINTTGRVEIIGTDTWGNQQHGIIVDAGDLDLVGGVHYSQPDVVEINNASSLVNINAVRTHAITNPPFNVTMPASLVFIGDDNVHTSLPANTGAVANPANLATQGVASASTVQLPANGTAFNISGTTNVDTINGGWTGRMVVLIFDAALTVNDNTGNLQLAGNLTTAANATLTLVGNGSGWIEIARSAN